MSAGSSATPLPGRALGSALRPLVANQTVLAGAPVAIALILWAFSFRSIDLSRIGSYGLLDALPWTYYAALAFLTLGFTLSLRVARQSVLAAYVITLIMIIHGTPTIAYGTLRYAWAWKHVGIVDYIQRHGSVDPSIAVLPAYHNWPGFFAFNALYTELAGFSGALSYAAWAPVFFNLAFLAALVPLFGALTTDRRRVWLGAWIFFSASWVGQDYFSPQAFAYFLFLVVVAVCVTWFRLSTQPTAEAAQRFLRKPRLADWFARTVARADTEDRWHWYADVGPWERVALVGIVLLLCATIAFSHQLTPFMLILAIGGLVVFQRISLRGLPLLVGAISLGWVVLFSVGFLRGNLYWIAASFGTLTSNADSTLINLSHASPGQQVIAQIGRALTLGVWVLGALGFVRLLRIGRFELASGVLALAPFAMLGATSYGGEILFRVYFFALPFFALLAAGLFYPEGRLRGHLEVAIRGLVAVLLISGLLFAYYGKEAQNYLSKAEVDAAKFLSRTSVPGSLIVGGLNDYPWSFSHYEDYLYQSLGDLELKDRRDAILNPARTIFAIAQRDNVPCAYVMITSSQKAAVDATGVMPAGSLDVIERRLAASPQYVLLLHNKSAALFGVAVERSRAQCRLGGATG